jgi:orotidine-5'-phosphate decarboxylase
MAAEIKSRVIVALDVDELEKAKNLVKLLKDDVAAFKIGKQLFTRCGPDAVKMVHDEGGRVFLDLKFHDIPTTVAKASLEVMRLGVFMFNMHASGGLDMMKKAVSEVKEKALEKGETKPIILAVTVLTSQGPEDLKRLGINMEMEEMVVNLASLAKEAGVDGVVASPKEIQAIRKACGKDFVIVTPGIRPASSSKDDQKRIMTPLEAVNAGADYIVVGRPITQAEDPLSAAQIINIELH